MRSPTEWRLYIDWHTKEVGLIIRVNRVLYSKKTKYQEVDIIESKELGKCLFIDGAIQSTTFDEYIYHEALVHPVMCTVEDPKNVLIIGGGEGASIREVLKYNVNKVTVVDIDEELVEACKEYLPEMHQGSFFNSKVQMIFTDGYKFIKENSQRYDAIILDLTDPTEHTSQRLYTKEFYTLIKERLNSNGAVVTQSTSPYFSPHILSIIHNTLEKVFKYVRAYIAPVRSYGGLWSFVIASDYKDPQDTHLKLDNLAFLDDSNYNSMFSLPKRLREMIDRETKVASNDNLVYMPAFEKVKE